MNWAFSDEFRTGEEMSANVFASARGLAKMGAYMANKGTFNGKTVMSKKAWKSFHAGESDVYDWTFKGITKLFNSGVSTYTDLKTDGTNPREGYFGWGGYGGSSLFWNPDLKISVAYIPSDLG